LGSGKIFWLYYDIEKFHVDNTTHAPEWLPGTDVTGTANKLKDTGGKGTIIKSGEIFVDAQITGSGTAADGHTGTRIQTVNNGIAKQSCGLNAAPEQTDLIKIYLTAQSNVSFTDTDIAFGYISTTELVAYTPYLRIVSPDPTGGTTPTPGDPAAYTVSPSGDAAATVGEVLDVAVLLTADPATAEYASVYAELTYNAAYFTPDLTGLNNVSEETPGTLKITDGPHSDTAVGADGATLVTIPFTPIAAGSATFAITSGSAKVYLQGAYDADDAIPAGSGASLSVTIEAAVTVIRGDVNGDGVVTIVDAQIIFDYLDGYHTDADSGLLARMDVTGSGGITAADYALVVDIIHGRA
jgi:hypothetical protein